MFHLKRLLAFFTFAVALLTITADSYGQCSGVFLKHTSTQFLPYQRLYLDSAADMNNDNRPDLLASQITTQINGSVRSRIYIIPNNGNGTFGAATFIDPPAQTPFANRYFVAKINNDTLNDIVAFYHGGSEPQSILVYINNGNGTFAPPVISSGGSRGYPYEFADLNNDGKLDYLGHNGGAVLSYSLGNGDGTFGSPVTIATTGGIAGSVDFNNDGKLDLVNWARIYINNGNGTFTQNDWNQYLASTESPFIVRDLTGDGLTDILASTSTGDFKLLRRTATGFDPTSYPGAGPGVGQPIYQTGNLNGDQYLDFVVSWRNENRKIVYTTGPAGLTRTESRQRYYTVNFLNKVYADFDGDGRDDLVQMTSFITNSELFLPHVTSINIHKNVCNEPGQTRIVDFDASGNTDYSFWNPATGDWSWRATPYDNETFQTETVNWGLGSLGDIPTPGDFDADGVTDRAVYRDSTGYWYIRRSSDAVWFVMRFGLPGDKPVVGDYDGDAISDIAVWRPSDGNWYIWYMGTQSFAAQHFGAEGDRPAPADYDGDLKTDVAVFRPSTGVWYTTASSNGVIAYSRWGLDGDRPMPADYDGDGKADIAVFRPSNGYMYLVLSYDSSAVYYPLGVTGSAPQPGDIPQIGDWDGDFVADIGFYRPSNRMWGSTIRAGAIFGADGAIPTSSIIPSQ